MRYFIILFFFFCSHNSVSAQDTTEIKIFWEQFSKALKARDTRLIKELSLPKINCDLCLNNGPSKIEALNKKINETPDWYEKLNSDWAYIPIDSFIKDDLDSFLPSDLIHQISVDKYVLQSDSLLLDEKLPPHIKPYLLSDKPYSFYNILLTSHQLKAFDGKSKQYTPVIQVLQTEKGFKFYGFWTIP